MPHATSSSAPESLRPWLQALLDDAVADSGCPGAALSVVTGTGAVVDVASGVLNSRTGHPVTTDSTFQIGSVTKVLTAVLVMQLVDEGLLDLDEPVTTYLPDFRTSDAASSAAITTRQLLSHTAGFEGDVFVDTGRGADAVAKLVDLLASVDQVSQPGEVFSYSNAGFVVLGRVVEVLRSASFERVLREKLLDPLGLATSATSADEAILGRAAVGHLATGQDGRLEPTTTWALPWSNAPAGAVLSMSAGDLARFGLMFLDGVLQETEPRVLSTQALREMCQAQVPCPDFARAPTARGLGWGRLELDGGATLAHDGGTVGQFAFLRVVPEANLVVSLLTNGGDSGRMSRSVVDAVMAQLGGVAFPGASVPSHPMPPLAPLEGAYGSGLFVMTAHSDGEGRLWLDVTPRPILADMGVPPETYELVPVSDAVFVRADGDLEARERYVFMGHDAGGRARYLHNGRAHVRTFPAER